MELNGWRAPDYRHTAFIQDIKFRMNAPKGAAIDQSLLYVDSSGADDWLALANKEDYDYANRSNELNMQTMAKLICHYLENSPFRKDQITVFGLGPGDGKQEGKLIRGILTEVKLERVRCQLLDLSPTLALEAHAHITDIFRKRRGIEISWLVGNFLNLPHYPEIFDLEDEKNTLRIATMFGGTFGNLNGELHFLRHSLHILKPGDLFMVEVVLVYAPVTDKDAIYATDPRLNGIWQVETETLVRGPIERYRKGVKSIRFESVLKIGTSAFPDSYTLEVQAVVNDEARFMMLQLHRYDLQSFVETIAKEGWKPLGGQTYGINHKRLVYLFQKL